MSEYHEFRTKKYKNLYFCKSCIRNFESENDEKNCKFCGNEVKKLAEQQKKQIFRYYCTKCDRNYTLSEQVNQCQACGHKFVHFYPWTVLRKRDKIRKKTFSIAERLAGILRKS